MVFEIYGLGHVDSGPRPKPKKNKNLGLDSEFNSIHFGKEINKCLKFETKKFLGLKISSKRLINF